MLAFLCIPFLLLQVSHGFETVKYAGCFDLKPFSPIIKQNGSLPYELVVEPEIIGFGTVASLTLKKINNPSESIVGFMMTAFDQFGNVVGKFIENDRYLKTEPCPLKKPHEKVVLDALESATISHTGPLHLDEVSFQWQAPWVTEVSQMPMVVQFHLTMSLPEQKTWVNEYIAKIILI